MKHSLFTLEPGEWYALESFGSGQARQHPHCSPVLVRSVRRHSGERGLVTLTFLEANDPDGAEEKTCKLQVLQHTSSHLAVQGIDPGELMVFFPLEDAWMQTHFPGVDRLMHVLSA